MANSKTSLYLTSILVSLVIFSLHTVNGQISTPCTSSMISSFSPCMNFITGSSRNGSSPVEDCCDLLKSLFSSSRDCACLIITGNVPFSIPFTRNLGISLPRMCKGRVPIQCKASGVPLPAPGPVLFGPTLAPTASAPGTKPRVLKAPPPDETNVENTPAPSPVVRLAPTGHPGIRPVLNPTSASNPSSVVLSPIFLLLILRIMVFDLY